MPKASEKKMISYENNATISITDIFSLKLLAPPIITPASQHLTHFGLSLTAHL